MPWLGACHLADLRDIAEVLWPSAARHLLDDLLHHLRDGPAKLHNLHPPRRGRPRVRPARRQSDPRGYFIGQLSRVGQKEMGNASPSVDHWAADLGLAQVRPSVVYRALRCGRWAAPGTGHRSPEPPGLPGPPEV